MLLPWAGRRRDDPAHNRPRRVKVAGVRTGITGQGGHLSSRAPGAELYPLPHSGPRLRGAPVLSGGRGAPAGNVGVAGLLQHGGPVAAGQGDVPGERARGSELL